MGEKTRLFAVSILGFLAFNLLLAAAVLANPGFALFADYLSDLGNPSAPSSAYFNAACVLAGAAVAAVFYLLGRQALGMLCGIVLALVGIFPQGSPHGLHFIFSAAFFFLGGAQALFYCMARARELGWKDWVAALGGLHALISLALGAAEALQAGAPLFEALAVFSFQLFVLAAVFKS
jgi:hypothetical membrane protein